MNGTIARWCVGGRGRAAGLVALVNGLFAAWVLLKPVPRDLFITVDNLAQLLGMLLGLTLCAWPLGRPGRGAPAAARPAGTRRWIRPRGAPFFLGLAILCQSVGQVIYTYYEDIRHQAILFPSWADIAYLCVYPFALVGILRLVRRPLSGATRARVLLDGLLLMVALVTFNWFFILGPTVLQAGQTPFAAAVGAAYPLGDLLLMVCLLLLAGRVGDGRGRSALGLLALALGTIVATDSVYDYQLLHNGYATGALLDVGWALGYSLLGLGARALRYTGALTLATDTAGSAMRAREGKGEGDSAPAITPSAPRLWRALLPYILVPAVLALVVYTWELHGDPRLDTGVYLGGAALVGLVLLRQVVAMREMIVLYANNDALNRANGQLAVANTQLEVLATTDPLTRLTNRALLRERVEHALAHAPRLALLLMDLDRFKEVNDTLGHQAGDLLLQRIGPRLRDVVRDGDTVARLGGDEFALLLPGADAEGAVRVTQALLGALAEPFDLEGRRVDIGASAGIALYPDHGADATTLLRQADVAMYSAKRARTGHAVYAAAQDRHTPHRLALMGELREALAAGALALHYQPLVALASGRMIGVEALLRWPHPERGLVPPDEFIPLAEHTGLIGAVTVWVLERALGQVAAWEATGLVTGVAVNLSAHTLHEPGVYDMVAEALQRHQVAPARLTLEVTESALMLDPDHARAVLGRLRALGVRVSIDDFGTGYSSLGYLKDLPADEVKIDKGFVLGMGAEGHTGAFTNAALVQSIVAMAHALGLGVVAEGVETAAVEQRLAALRCDTAQGYYLSRPVPPAEVERWARARASTRETLAPAV